MNCFTCSIHAPGFGRSRSHAGCALTARYGALIPAAIARNINRIMGPDCVKANPSAAPRNGAVQGVARTVAKTPWRNDPRSPSRDAHAKMPVLAPPGSVISKTPKRFKAKTSTSALMPTTKYGL